MDIVTYAMAKAYADSLRGSGTVEGYYYNGHFYKDEAHTEEIEPKEGRLYYDGHTTEVYIYDGTEFKVLGGLTYAAQFKDWEDDD